MTREQANADDSRLVALADHDLSDDQRRWVPATLREAYECWPAGWKVEMFDGALQFTNGAGPVWDWRSVAVAARAYPGWRVVLHDGYSMSVSPPALADPPQARDR